MKIALFSDIHANLPALEAMFADMDGKAPDMVYCLGDLVGYNTWPNEVINLIRKRRVATIAGNHDLKVKPNSQPSEKTYAYDLVTEEHKNYLLTLPAHIVLEFQLNGANFKMQLAHGSPAKVDEYVLEDTDEAHVLQLMQSNDILCVGHSHKPYYRKITTPSGTTKHVINTGSVGKPKDGNPQGCYVLLSIGETLEVEFVRFSYDIEKAASAIEASPLSNELAERLRLAY